MTEVVNIVDANSANAKRTKRHIPIQSCLHLVGSIGLTMCLHTHCCRVCQGQHCHTCPSAAVCGQKTDQTVFYLVVRIFEWQVVYHGHNSYKEYCYFNSISFYLEGFVELKSSKQESVKCSTSNFPRSSDLKSELKETNLFIV